MYVCSVCVCVCVVVVFHIGTIVAVVVFAAVLCNVHSILLCMHWGGSCMHKMRSVLSEMVCVFPAPCAYDRHIRMCLYYCKQREKEYNNAVP